MIKITIHRGAKEIGGTLIDLQSENSRIILDIGFPLFLDGNVVEKKLKQKTTQELLELGVLPKISGLYSWEKPKVDAVLISHAHLDHYGLLNFVHPEIPIYMSTATREIINFKNRYVGNNAVASEVRTFQMYEPFVVCDFRVMPFLMDHSAFDAAAFEINAHGKTLVYTGDFRCHGRKSVCLERFIKSVKKNSDLLLIEGTLMGRQDKISMTEQELESRLVESSRNCTGAILFQSSSQNIDRLVSFYRASKKLGRLFVIDLYTANVLDMLSQINHSRLPRPSSKFPNLKVFYPHSQTKYIYKTIGEEYAKRFSSYYISKDELKKNQGRVFMLARPSMVKDIEKIGFQDGLFIYSLWSGYREGESQKKFESVLSRLGFQWISLHTSGHADVDDLKRVIEELMPKRIVPIHTNQPEDFEHLSDMLKLPDDGVPFYV